MRSNSVSKIYVAGHLSRGNVDDHHVSTVGAWLADAGIAVHRHISRPAVPRRDHFMPGHAAFGDGRNLLLRDGIHDAQIPAALIGNEQNGALSIRGSSTRHTSKHYQRAKKDRNSCHENRFVGEKSLRRTSYHNALLTKDEMGWRHWLTLLLRGPIVVHSSLYDKHPR